jgi:mannose-6-phosphate isomerase-like protein (cupin superfamily)
MAPSETSFSVARLDTSPFADAGELRPGWDYRDLGIERATSGRFDAHIVRAKKGKRLPIGWHAHDYEFSMSYVLKGWMKLEFAHGVELCEVGSCVCQPSRIPHAVLDYSEDLEVLEINMPAKFKTYDVERPQQSAAE